MGNLIPLHQKEPQIGTECFIANNASIIGDVQIGDHCSVWFNAVIRGDVSPIKIGHHSNVQDGAVIHGTYKRSSTQIGNYVSIAHNAIVHGCTIEDYVLIGMGAIIMDHAVIKKYSIIAAGAIVLANTVVEEGSIWGGNPAQFIKPIGDKKDEIERIAKNYPLYASWYKDI